MIELETKNKGIAFFIETEYDCTCWTNAFSSLYYDEEGRPAGCPFLHSTNNYVKFSRNFLETFFV